MKNINIVRYNETKKEEWNSFLKVAKNKTFLFERDFMDYHSDRFEDYSLMMYDEKQNLIAVLPANIKDNELYTHQGLTYGGLVTNVKSKLSTYVNCFYSICFFLHNKGIEFIYFKQIPSIYNKFNTDEIDYVSFLLKAQLYRRDVGISVSLENKTTTYSGNYRREAKKAKQQGVIVKKENVFKDFWEELLTPNLLTRFNKKPVHNLEEIVRLQSLFPNNIVQYNAYLNNKIIAGTTLFIDEDFVHCQYISSNESGRKSGGLNFLFIYLIDEIYKNKKVFDFGIVNEQNGRFINKGMLFWKENMGGRAIKHDFYKIETKNHFLLKSLI